MGFVLAAPLAVGYMEHKVWPTCSHRLGPMYAGGFHGWAQLIADGVKFVQKEDVIPPPPTRWSSRSPRPWCWCPTSRSSWSSRSATRSSAENLDVGHLLRAGHHLGVGHRRG